MDYPVSTGMKRTVRGGGAVRGELWETNKQKYKYVYILGGERVKEAENSEIYQNTH